MEVKDREFARESSTYLASLPLELVVCTIQSSRLGAEATCGRIGAKCSRCHIALDWVKSKKEK